MSHLFVTSDGRLVLDLDRIMVGTRFLRGDDDEQGMLQLDTGGGPSYSLVLNRTQFDEVIEAWSCKKSLRLSQDEGLDRSTLQQQVTELKDRVSGNDRAIECLIGPIRRLERELAKISPDWKVHDH